MGMSGVLNTLFEGIGQPITEDGDGTLYTVRSLPGNSHVLVGKDRDSLASVLIRTKGESMRRRAPIALENMDVQFGILCRQIVPGERAMSGRFTVIRCLARDRELKRYFLSVCEVVCRRLARPREMSRLRKRLQGWPACWKAHNTRRGRGWTDCSGSCL